MYVINSKTADLQSLNKLCLTDKSPSKQSLNIKEAFWLTCVTILPPGDCSRLYILRWPHHSQDRTYKWWMASGGKLNKTLHQYRKKCLSFKGSQFQYIWFWIKVAFLNRLRSWNKRQKLSKNTFHSSKLHFQVYVKYYSGAGKIDPSFAVSGSINSPGLVRHVKWRLFPPRTPGK